MKDKQHLHQEYCYHYYHYDYRYLLPTHTTPRNLTFSPDGGSCGQVAREGRACPNLVGREPPQHVLDRHEAARRCTHQIATTILLIVSSGIGHLKVRAEMLKATEGAGTADHLGRIKGRNRMDYHMQKVGQATDRLCFILRPLLFFLNVKISISLRWLLPIHL